jgi:predicted nucleotidyltransferase
MHIGKHLQHLSENEHNALETFVSRLRQLYCDDVQLVMLFGSKARGDFDEQSDLDLLVVVRYPSEVHWRHWQQIANIAWEVELKYGVVLTTIIRTPAAFKQMQRDRLLLYRNIERDGVSLWTLTPDVLMYRSV